MWSGPTVVRRQLAASLDGQDVGPMPSIWAPIGRADWRGPDVGLARRVARATVVPSPRRGHERFSVAVTAASSRKMSSPSSRFASNRRSPRHSTLGAERSRRECGSSPVVGRSRPPRGRHSDRPTARAWGRRGESRPGCSREQLVGPSRWPRRPGRRISFGPVQSVSRRGRARTDHLGLGVADPRDVRQLRARLVGEQARRQDRQGAVLVPGGTHMASERVTAFDHERLRGYLPDESGRQGGGYPSGRLDTDSRPSLGDVDPLHEERGAAAARAGRRGLDAASARSREGTRSGRAAGSSTTSTTSAFPTRHGPSADGNGRARAAGYPDEIVERWLAPPTIWASPARPRWQGRSSPVDELSGFMTRAGSCGRPVSRAGGEVGAQEAQAAVVRRRSAP